MDHNHSEATPENRPKTVFDGEFEPKRITNPISVERALELDAILGKALLERFKKEEINFSERFS